MYRRHESPDTPGVVLYADDDPNDLFLVQRAFERWQRGVEVRTVVSGEAAIDYLAGAAEDQTAEPLPHIVLLDLIMPFKDGFEVLNWIRHHPKLSELPVIILSSSDRPRDRDRAMAMGATHYISKEAAFLEVPEQIAPWLPTAHGGSERREMPRLEPLRPSN